MWRWLAALAVMLAMVGGDAAVAQQKKGADKAASPPTIASMTASAANHLHMD